MAQAVSVLSSPRGEEVYRPDIDGLRAISIVSVVGFHAVPSIFRGGFVGVDIFFVISGFLISGIIFTALDEKRFSFFEFYGRRVRRIFPALLAVLCASILIGWLTLLDDEFRQLGRHVVAATLFLSNFQLRVEAGYFDAVAALKPLLHLWSLSIEEQFYLLWPAILYMAHRFRLPLPWIILGILASSFAYAALRVSSAPTTIFYSPLSRFWELMLGSFLSFALTYREAGICGMIQRSVTMRRRNIASLVGTMLIVFAVLRLDDKTPYPGVWALLPTFGAALLIAAGPNAFVNRRVLAGRVFVFVGLISYPLYLWHWPLLSFARILWSGTVPYAVTGATVLLSVVLAWLTWRLIERPCRSLRLAYVVPPLIGLAASIGAFGFAIYSHDGFPSRPGASGLARFELDKLDSEKAQAERSGLCHINDPTETLNGLRQKAQACLRVVPGMRNVLVFGDSHAGDLWIALSQGYGRFNFLQATGAGCNPSEENSAEFARHCRVLFDYINNEFLQNNKVDVIAIAARWTGTYRSMLSQIRHYQSLGIAVVVFGPTFEYLADVPRIIARKRSGGALDSYLDARLNQQRFSLNRDMAQFAAGNGIAYVDVIGLLCSGGHCPAIEPHDEKLYVRDYGHWTLQGAKVFGALLGQRRVLDP